MIEGKDIGMISMSITAGVLSAAIVFSSIQPALHAYTMASACSAICYAAACTAFFLQSVGNPHAQCPAVWICTFFCLGFLCRTTQTFAIPHSTVQDSLSGIRTAICSHMDAIPFQHRESNALMRALILGDRSAIDRVTITSFRKAGAAHILALSGMHLGIIYVIVNRLLGVIGFSVFARKAKSAATIAITFAYTMICGASASLMRAWLFILLREAGFMLDRPQQMRNIFCSALTLHLVISPASISTLGFQLSYCAVMGIIFLWPHAREWFTDRESPVSAKIWEIASLGICAQIFTAPLTLYHFGTFPKYFMLTNILAAPLTGIVMICCIAALIAEMLAPGIPAAAYEYLEYPLTALREILGLIAGLP